VGALLDVLVLNGRGVVKALIPAMVLVLMFANRAVVAGQADASQETVVSERLDGPGWIWVNARTQPGSPLDFRVWAYDRGPPFAHGSMFGATAGTYKEQIRVATNDSEFRENTGFLMAPWPDGLVSRYQVGNAVTWIQALVWVAGNVSSWSYEIRGHGLEIGELATGNSSFLYLSHDFEAPLAIEAYVGVGARVQLDAVKEIRFEGFSVGGYVVNSAHSFVGLRDLGFREPTTELKWTNSTGIVRECPCLWYPPSDDIPQGYRGGESGLHRFEFSTISAGESQIDEIWLTGVDFGGFRSSLWE